MDERELAFMLLRAVDNLSIPNKALPCERVSSESVQRLRWLEAGTEWLIDFDGFHFEFELCRHRERPSATALDPLNGARELNSRVSDEHQAMIDDC